MDTFRIDETLYTVIKTTVDINWIFDTGKVCAVFKENIIEFMQKEKITWLTDLRGNHYKEFIDSFEKKEQKEIIEWLIDQEIIQQKSKGRIDFIFTKVGHEVKVSVKTESGLLPFMSIDKYDGTVSFPDYLEGEIDTLRKMGIQIIRYDQDAHLEQAFEYVDEDGDSFFADSYSLPKLQIKEQ